MNIDELQKKYKDTGVTAISAMMALEDAKGPTRFQLKLDHAQAMDWVEFQHYKAMKTIDGIGIEKIKEMMKNFDRGN